MSMFLGLHTSKVGNKQCLEDDGISGLWAVYVKSSQTILHGKTEIWSTKKTERLCVLWGTLLTRTYGGFRETVVLDHGVCIAVVEETPCPVTWSGSLLVLDPTLYFERLVSENMPTIMSTLNLPNLFCSDKLFLGESLYFSKRLMH